MTDSISSLRAWWHRHDATRQPRSSRAALSAFAQRARLFACVAVALVACGHSAALMAASSPNVVIIYADDLGLADISHNEDRYVSDGAPYFVHTPHIDKICSQGVYLDDYVTHHVCSPSRAGLLTGLQPAKVRSGLGVGYHMADDAYTIGHHFQNAGYRTAVLGKWHNSDEESNHPNHFGFDYWEGFYAGGQDNFSRVANDDPDADSPDKVNWWTNGNLLKNEIYHGGNRAYTTNIIRNRALNLIDGSLDDGKPFMLYIPMPTVHTPYDITRTDLKEMCDYFSPRGGQYSKFNWNNVQDWRAGPGLPRLGDKENLRCGRKGEYSRRDIEQFENAEGFGELVYYTMIYNMDKAVGAIIDDIEDRGLLNDTIFVFASDNGGVKSGNNGELRGYKKEIFEGGIKVPGAIWYNGTLDKNDATGGTYNHLVRYIDLFPTITGLAGLPSVSGLDGKDLSNNIINGTMGSGPTDGDGLFFGLDDRWASARGNRYKLHYNQAIGPGRVNELYDLVLDSDESNNLLDGSLNAGQQSNYDFLVEEIEAWFDSGEVTASYMRPPTAIRGTAQAPDPKGDILRLRARITNALVNPANDELDSSEAAYFRFARPFYGPDFDKYVGADHLLSFDMFIPSGPGENRGIVVTPEFNDVDNITTDAPLHNLRRGVDISGRLLGRENIPKGVWRRCVVSIGDAAPLRSNKFAIGILGPSTGDYEVFIDNVEIIDSSGALVESIWKDDSDTFTGGQDFFQEGEWDDGYSKIKKFSNVSIAEVNIGNTPPSVQLTATPGAGRTINFSSAGSSDNGSIVSRQWTFGDGSQSTAANPTKTYANDGSYFVVLTLTDNNGLRSQARVTVNVGGGVAPPPPAADPEAVLNVSATTISVGESVTFSGAGSTAGPGENIEWYRFYYDWANDSYVNVQRPGNSYTHTYTTPGTYQVRLRVWDTSQDVDNTVLQTIVVTAGDGGEVDPEAVLSLSATTISVGESVTFSGAGSTAGPGENIEWYRFYYDWANASYVNVQRPGNSYTHTYTTPGTYQVRLRVWDTSKDLDNSIIQTIVVTEGTGSELEAVLDLSSTTVAVGEAVTFSGVDSTAGPGESIEWYRFYYDFANAAFQTVKAPGNSSSHTYTTPGTYQVRLRVWDGAGEWDDSPIQTIVVSADGGDAPTYDNNGEPWAVPAGGSLTIQAEDFDTEGADISYKDNTPGNSKGDYRTDVDVDIDAGAGGFVVEVRPYEWMIYTIDVPSAGTYTITSTLAAGANPRRLAYTASGNSTGFIDVAATGSYGSFTTASGTIELSAGVQKLRMIGFAVGAGDVGRFDLDYLTISAAGGDGVATLVGDAYVDNRDGKQTVNYDNSGLRLYPDGRFITLLEFDVSEFTGPQVGFLNLHSIFAGNGTIEVRYDNSSNWNEATVDYLDYLDFSVSNTVLGEISGSYANGQEVNIPLTGVPVGGGSITFIVESTTGSLLNFQSKDSPGAVEENNPSLELWSPGDG